MKKLKIYQLMEIILVVALLFSGIVYVENRGSIDMFGVYTGKQICFEVFGSKFSLRYLSTPCYPRAFWLAVCYNDESIQTICFDPSRKVLKYKSDTFIYIY